MQLFCGKVSASVVGRESSHFVMSLEKDGRMCHSIETHLLFLAVAKRKKRERKRGGGGGGVREKMKK